MEGKEIKKYSKMFRPLEASEIEVKISSGSKEAARKHFYDLLIYKTARTDMDILDEYIGPENWQCLYEEVKGNVYCTIEIWNEEKQDWVGKSDCGTESDFGDKEKGEASDAFKRAGFRWGIGRELYSAPKIRLWFDSIEDKNSKKYESYHVSTIEYTDGKITKLGIKDSKGNIIFKYKEGVK